MRYVIYEYFPLEEGHGKRLVWICYSPEEAQNLVRYLNENSVNLCVLSIESEEVDL